MPQGQEKGRDGTNTLRPPSAFGVDVLQVGSQPQQPSLGQGILQRHFKEMRRIQVPSGATSQAPEQDKGGTRPL